MVATQSLRFLFLLAAAAGIIRAAPGAQNDVDARYWRALNEGRDVRSFEAAAEKLTFPALRDATWKEGLARALQALDRAPALWPRRRRGGSKFP